MTSVSSKLPALAGFALLAVALGLSIGASSAEAKMAWRFPVKGMPYAVEIPDTQSKATHRAKLKRVWRRS